mmetsp:Transcript_57555/g.65665  ORF Transcript_57555/g.65665 Transcript_57555/m.65665 type:complete len:238 (-) Transcript_57555:1806-2519(-)
MPLNLVSNNLIATEITIKYSQRRLANSIKGVTRAIIISADSIGDINANVLLNNTLIIKGNKRDPSSTCHCRHTELPIAGDLKELNIPQHGSGGKLHLSCIYNTFEVACCGFELDEVDVGALDVFVEDGEIAVGGLESTLGFDTEAEKVEDFGESGGAVLNVDTEDKGSIKTVEVELIGVECHCVTAEVGLPRLSLKGSPLRVNSVHTVKRTDNQSIQAVGRNESANLRGRIGQTCVL